MQIQRSLILLSNYFMPQFGIYQFEPRYLALFKLFLIIFRPLLQPFHPLGLDLNDVWKASARAFKTHYPKTDSSSWIWLRTGHGMGLDYSDPILTEAFRYPYELSERKDKGDQLEKRPIRIEAGMLLMLHPNVFIPNEAAGAIGDMVLVTEDGYEILNGFPRELIIW